MGTGLSKRDGKGKILDNHNKICYSYEHKSSCELYLHIICGCFLCVDNEESGRTTVVVRGESAESIKNKSRRNGNEKCKLERIIH